ncbi:MAG: hypothetical protein R3B09_07770 [Nannocystaceae bacterium]
MVFEAHPELRRVEIGQVIDVDPQQTRLPEDWKSLSPGAPRRRC